MAYSFHFKKYRRIYKKQRRIFNRVNRRRLRNKLKIKNILNKTKLRKFSKRQKIKKNNSLQAIRIRKKFFLVKIKKRHKKLTSCFKKILIYTHILFKPLRKIQTLNTLEIKNFRFFLNMAKP